MSTHEAGRNVRLREGWVGIRNSKTFCNEYWFPELKTTPDVQEPQTPKPEDPPKGPSMSHVLPVQCWSVKHKQLQHPDHPCQPGTEDRMPHNSKRSKKWEVDVPVDVPLRGDILWPASMAPKEELRSPLSKDISLATTIVRPSCQLLLGAGCALT